MHVPLFDLVAYRLIRGYFLDGAARREQPMASANIGTVRRGRAGAADSPSSISAPPKAALRKVTPDPPDHELHELHRRGPARTPPTTGPSTTSSSCSPPRHSWQPGVTAATSTPPLPSTTKRSPPPASARARRRRRRRVG